ncbi:hypothetical protein VNO77_15339 [Canavalia gladiata]|uniref:Uncharacterized protein n=1 Tax=Canavalia gladiata TaxID=3824 RepID=A0AAN9LZF9_CANGL
MFMRAYLTCSSCMFYYCTCGPKSAWFLLATMHGVELELSVGTLPIQTGYDLHSNNQADYNTTMIYKVGRNLSLSLQGGLVVNYTLATKRFGDHVYVINKNRIFILNSRFSLPLQGIRAERHHR